LNNRHPPALLAWSVWGLGACLYLIAFFHRVAPAVFTDQLMTEFSLGAAALGNLSAFYFYAYVAMQIPTGILADRYGPRRVLAAGAGVATLGSLVFAMAPSFAWAAGGRLLIGASVAVGFVSMMKLASHWFAPRQFAFATGMALLMGVIGGVIGGVPLRLLVEAFGWRALMGATAVISAALCIATWLLVRDDPAERGYVGHGSRAHHESTSVLRGIAEVLSYRNAWLLSLAPIGFSGCVLTFAGLWGVPWLRQVYSLDATHAVAITSTLLVSWAVSGPVLGSASQRLGRRKPLYAISSAMALLGWAAVIYLALPLWLLVGVLALTGLASGGLIIGFAWAKESVPLRLMGTAGGICNMGPLLGGMLLQPGVGWVLDRYWSGAQVNGVRLYDAAAWQAGFTLMFVTACLSLAALIFARESHCRQAV
jgi:MFS family permease